MGYDVWKTLFTNDFNASKYIYHYTTIENAKQIISANEICFSDLSRTNDLAEEKVRIAYVDKKKAINLENSPQASEINRFFQRRSKLLQLLCFCKDSQYTESKLKNLSHVHPDHNTDQYFDVTGRGFSLPYMWSRYPEGDGVCLIINKAAFEKQIDVDVDFCVHGSVKYYADDRYYKLDCEKQNALYEKLLLYNANRASVSRVIQKEPVYIEYNFLHKNIAWLREQEYRYISLKNQLAEQVSVKALGTYLEGVVCSEKIRLLDEKDLKKLVCKICELQKITFRDKYYRLL